MRLEREIKKSGFFWLPSLPDNKIAGNITISDGGNIELEIVGSFYEPLDEFKKGLNNDNNLGRILGNIEEYGSVTLEKCFYKNKKNSFDGISKSNIHVEKALLGVAYNEENTISINNFRFSIEGIDEWTNINGIDIERDLNQETVSIKYTPPKEIKIYINKKISLSIVFSWSFPSYPIVNEAKIVQKTYFEIKSESGDNVEYFTSIAYKIANLLSFAIDKTVCLKEISFTSESIYQTSTERNFHPKKILLFYASLPHVKEKPTINQDHMLFMFEMIKDNTETVIKKWFDAYEIISPALNLYFSAKVGAHKYQDGKFLALVQGIETYSRRTIDEKRLSNEEFNTLVDRLIESCPEEHKEWLHGRLNHGNEINLSKRIKIAIEPFKEILGKNKEREKMIRSIVDTRNYLTHYDQRLKEKAATSGKQLYLLCLKMEAIFQLNILNMLGFSKNEIVSIIEKNSNLRRKIKEGISI
ncbi:HEPN domain-containing protein [Pectobacterium polaris]|uniref:ApeA N-terminal domain 1-containing protein n=1 Tax=Pectobacterium polaris TaxID=2042057 RepID=UPI002B2548E4|nr:HEPN domain-containing protein [Pectobacterium polaris]